MKKEILDQLKKITEEEQIILEGQKEINKELYMEPASMTVDCKILLEHGKLIQVRPHTRFTSFPKHTHNYVEMVYMCQGSTSHIINGSKVLLKEGEILLLSQHAVQEILPAKEEDIAINFIVLPEFFDTALKMMEEDENQLRDFIIECLKGKNLPIEYLHFKVADVLPVQNLVENLIWTIMNDIQNKRSMNQITMGLLFLQLINHIDRIENKIDNLEQSILLTVYKYIEEKYKEGELTELAGELNYDLYWLSRMIKKLTGKTYTELVQTKRLSQATYLLEHTKMTVSDIGYAVGYDNLSYFHKLFYRKYNLSPKQYRINSSKKSNI